MKIPYIPTLPDPKYEAGIFESIVSTKPLTISPTAVAVIDAAIAAVLASVCVVSSTIAPEFASICPVCPPVNVSNSVIAVPCKSLLILI